MNWIGRLISTCYDPPRYIIRDRVRGTVNIHLLCGDCTGKPINATISDNSERRVYVCEKHLERLLKVT